MPDDASALSLRPGTQGDLAALSELLTGAQLPTEDLTDAALQFWLLESQREVVGAIALERCGRYGLLRSLAVAPGRQRQGCGRQLVEHLECEAQTLAVRQLLLLTLSAQSFFERLGYQVISREKAPLEITRSAQFRALCPASAVCMHKVLG